MKKIFTCIICFVLLCSFSVLTFAITENNNEEYVELREDQNILLSINSKDAKKYSDNNLIINTINELDSSIHSKKCIEDVEVIFDSSRRTPQREDNVAIIKIALTDFGSKQIEQLIAALKKDENISSAEKDYLFKINDTDNSSTVNVNDTRISEQYAITNTHANMAWAFITGNGYVDTDDARSIERISVGLDP